jgi:hypothetical protein
MAQVNWHNLEVGQIAEILKTDLKMGLSEKEVQLRQKN